MCVKNKIVGDMRDINDYKTRWNAVRTIKVERDFPGGPVVKTLHSHCRGHGVRSLVGVRSCMLCSLAKKKKKIKVER